ncbi:MAG: polyprenyl synthetase family protein, partial [Planctomycetota bacterium]
EYGVHFGTAFQIVDDCLDLTGDEKVVGKSLGTDLDKGKLTLPVLLLLRALPESARGEVRGMLASPDGAPEKRGRVRRMLEEHDIVEATMRRAREFAEQARGSLAALDGSPYVEHLGALVGFCLHRRR